LLLNSVFVLYFHFISPVRIDITTNHILFYIYLNFCWILFSLLFDVFNFRQHLQKRIILFKTTQVGVFFLVAFLVYFQWNPDLKYLSKEEKQLLFPVFFLFLITWKIGLHYAFLAYRKRGSYKRNVIILGDDSVSTKLFDFFKDDKWHGYKCQGIVTVSDNRTTPGNLGNISDLAEILNSSRADEIYVAMGAISKLKDRGILGILQNLPIEIRIIPDLGDFSYFSMDIVDFGNVPVLALHPSPLSHPRNKFIKRTFDFVFASLVIICFLSWLVPILWAIDIFSKGNGIFFIQKRTSIYGKEFNIIKFRTMIPNAAADTQQAVEKDARITPLGAFLRKTSIDELPQFINVLKGDMSVVGPRPHMLKHTEEYKNLVNSFMHRHTVKPGITGLAQVSGYRGEIRTQEDIANRVELDINYIRNWNFWLDLGIIWKTIWLTFP
jgi:putative colanic acid biosynthesis UDP-glucose lipid carrier transferase